MKNQPEVEIFIFIALDCEAKPLIKHLALKKLGNHPFSIYANKNYVLTVAGLGKNAMAGAVAYAMAHFPDVRFPVLLNVGIAGHKTREVGELLLAMKIVDIDTGKHFYPQLSTGNWPHSSELRTSSIAVTNYEPDCMYDMEGSAFYELAVKFSPSELIHSIKVISDNEHSSIEQIQPKTVQEWISAQIREIERVINNLLSFRALVVQDKDTEYQALVKKYHFTVSAEIRLKALLQRWHVLSGEQWMTDQEKVFVNAKAVLQQLECDVNNLTISL